MQNPYAKLGRPVYKDKQSIFQTCFSFLIPGKQIDGIWHTGIVVYGREYFFGGDGIMNCPPVSISNVFQQ